MKRETFYTDSDFTNPYYEKWSRGRPTKEKIERRKLSIEWEQRQIKEHPERYPFLTFLLTKPTPIVKSKGKQRTVRILYKSRVV